MKNLVIIIGATAFALVAATWAKPASPREEPASEQSKRQSRMKQKEEDIRQRVKMSAPLGLPEEGEEDFVLLAEKEGWIIEATLGEVEAALNAAKATPSIEDDVAAARMAHWGSYRFYLEDKGTPDAIDKAGN